MYLALAHAGVPNYPKGNRSGRYAEGNIFGSPVRTATQNAPTIVIENITLQVSSLIGTDAATEIFVNGATTDAGQRVIVKNVKIAKSNREI